MKASEHQPFGKEKRWRHDWVSNQREAERGWGERSTGCHSTTPRMIYNDKALSACQRVSARFLLRRKVRSEKREPREGFFSTSELEKLGEGGGKMSRKSDKEGQRIMARQESCPLSTGQPNLTDQADSSLLICPWRSACPAPGPRPWGVGQHQYLGSLCSCSDSLLRWSGSGHWPPAFSAAKQHSLRTQSRRQQRHHCSPSEDCFSAYVAVTGRNYPRQTQRGGQLNDG